MLSYMSCVGQLGYLFQFIRGHFKIIADFFQLLCTVGIHIFMPNLNQMLRVASIPPYKTGKIQICGSQDMLFVDFVVYKPFLL